MSKTESEKQSPIHPRIQKLTDHLASETKALPHLLRGELGKKARIRLPKPRQASSSLTGLAFRMARKHPSLTGGVNDAQELLDRRDYLYSLEQLAGSLRGHLLQVEDSIRKLKTDLWMEAMRIYTIAQRAQELGAEVTEFVLMMREELAHGPRMQTSTTVPLAEPIPKTKAGLKKLALERAKAEAAKKPS